MQTRGGKLGKAKEGLGIAAAAAVTVSWILQACLKVPCLKIWTLLRKDESCSYLPFRYGEGRLDEYYNLAQEIPEGVLTEEDIERLVLALDQPELLEPLLSLRSKAMREATRTEGFMDPRISSGGSSSDGGAYVKLPEQETAPPQQQEQGGAGAEGQRKGIATAGAWREAISSSVRQWKGESAGAKGAQQEEQQREVQASGC